MLENKKFIDINDLFMFAKEYAINNDISKILLFIQKAENLISFYEILKGSNITLIATTFPLNQIFYLQNDDGEIEEFHAKINDEIDIIKKYNIPLVASSLPFDPIIIPGSTDKTHTTISQTLKLFGRGVDLAIQSALMATDNGKIKPNTRVLSLTTKTIVDLNTTHTKYLFHPEIGLKIHQIINA